MKKSHARFAPANCAQSFTLLHVAAADSVKAALHGLDAAATQAWLEGLTAELAGATDLDEDLNFLIVITGLLAQRCTHRECMELFLERSADHLRSALLDPPEFFSKVQIKTSAVQVRVLVSLWCIAAVM